MLSQEIYDSWNAKTLADLQDLLDNIGGPTIPSNVRSSTFKTAVLKKIEKRRVAERRKSLEAEFDFFNYEDLDSQGCCARCCSGRCGKKKRLARRPTKIFDCQNLEMFEALCTSATKRFSRTISSVKALIQKLSYWESIKPGTDGLSVVGGYIWLLSFACQHLIDSPIAKEEYRMGSHIHEIKELYQVLAQAGELFYDMTESFHENALAMRMEGLTVLQKLTKKWKIDKEHNPLQIRGENTRAIPRPRKRIGHGLDYPCDTEDDDDVFSVKWSPLVVYIQVENEQVKPFGKLHPQDRIIIFRKFLKFTLNQVEMAAEDVTIIARGLQDISIDLESSPNHSGREITHAMMDFSRSRLCPKLIEDAKRHKNMIHLLNEFWYSLDVLYENILVTLRLVEETRDIIRTCYVYADIFYKWHMPSYDNFLSKNKTRRSEATVQAAKDILNKLSSPSEKKLSETTSILTLMDFSSSIYQGVVQEIPVQCDGMVLSLKHQETLESKDEPMGLVSGIVDKRKSAMGLNKR